MKTQLKSHSLRHSVPSIYDPLNPVSWAVHTSLVLAAAAHTPCLVDSRQFHFTPANNPTESLLLCKTSRLRPVLSAFSIIFETLTNQPIKL